MADMSPALDYSDVKARIASFDKIDNEENYERQTVLNLSVGGLYLLPDAPLDTHKIMCYYCGLSTSFDLEGLIQSIDCVDSLHTRTCRFHRACATILDTQDVRVAALGKHDYVDSLPVRVLVGSQPKVKEFTVHEALICPRSKFFHNAIEGPWKESEERVITLSEDEPEVFRIYLKYLYTGTLAVKDARPSCNDSSAIADEYATLSFLFVLAEKLMDEEAKSATLAALSARSEEPFFDGILYYPAIDSVQIIYEGTPEQSPARKLLVDLYTKFVTSAFVTEKSDAISKDFLYDLSLSLLTTRPLFRSLESALEEKSSALREVKELRALIARKNTQRRRYIYEPTAANLGDIGDSE